MKKYLPGISVDSLFLHPTASNPIIRSKNQLYEYNLNELFLYENNNPTPLLPEFYNTDSTVYSFTRYQEGYLLGIGKGLFYFQNGAYRKWSFPMDQPMGKITLISSCEDNFYFYQEGVLYFWNNHNYLLSQIGKIPNLKSITNSCDRWSVVWASDGELLYRIGNPNNRLPILRVTKKNKSKSRDGDLELHIRAYHPNPELLTFQFRGSDDDQWQEIPIQRSLRIADLGKQIKEVQFRLTVDDKYFAYSPVFENRKSDSSTWPWWLGFAPVFIAAIGFYFAKKEKNHTKELNAIKEKYLLQEQLEKWQYQAKSLQMNPHFLFNCLNSINALISLGENGQARNYLQKFSTLMREVLYFGDIDRIPLHREIDYLKNYLELEKLSRNNHFDYQVISQAEEDIHLPPMLIQPFLENAIIHGISGVKNGKIQLTFREERNHLVVKIEDNGIGISSKVKAKTNHHSKAISIVEHRLHSFSKFRKGKLQIKDKSLDSNNETGTVIIIKIPI